jgi:hypothetical protein
MAVVREFETDPSAIRRRPNTRHQA